MSLNTERRTWSLCGLVVAVSVVVSLLGGRFQLPTGEAAGEPQNLIRLESRMNQIEQRLYSIEVNIRNLEQQVQQVRLSTDAPAAGGRVTRDSEMLLMRREIETSRQRLEEIACALLRVDERTLTPAAREARRKSASDDDDPCRLNSGVPLRLSIRP